MVMASCAHLKNSAPLSPLSLAKKIQKVCLTGEGTGRLRFKNNKLVFGLSSHLDDGQKTWTLGLDLPGGEEVLAFHYSLGKASGSFFQKLNLQVQAMEKGPYYKDMLQRFIANINQFLRLYHSSKKNPSKTIDWGLFQVGQTSSEEQNLLLVAPMGKAKKKFLLEGLRLKKTYYQLLRLKMGKMRSIGPLYNNSPIEINLFYSACTRGRRK